MRSKVLHIAAWIILLCGFFGMIDSSFLVLEYIAAAAHPGELTPCSPSSLVSCTKTVQGVWAHVIFGIPNPMFGMLWYSGFTLYGAALVLGTRFSRRARALVGAVLIAGLVFSYRLYLASVLELRGVCPFCLFSTTASTLIALAFAVEDRVGGPDAVSGGAWRMVLAVFQVFSVAVFVIGLPVFVAVSLPLLLEPWEALEHWSFPVMCMLVLAMGAAHLWAFRALRRS